MAGFEDARRRALLQDLFRRFRGRETELVPFEAVREGLRLRHFVDRGVREVPVAQIVGSLGRTREFNRAFAPRDEALRERWEGVRRLVLGQAGLPPVELFQVDEAFFVVDGHHRVSVARDLGAPTIEARVREFASPLPLGPDVSVEKLLLQRGLADFVVETGLSEAGGEPFRVTVADGYQRLLDHIAVHRYYRCLETGREVGWPEAVRSWRSAVFDPAVEAIETSGVMAEFPDRTVADLYLYLMDRLHLLRERLGEGVGPAEAAEELRREAGPRRRRRRRSPRAADPEGGGAAP